MTVSAPPDRVHSALGLESQGLPPPPNQGPQWGEGPRQGVMSNQTGMNSPEIRSPGGSPYLQFREQPLAQVPGTVIPQSNLALVLVKKGTRRQDQWLRGVWSSSPTGQPQFPCLYHEDASSIKIVENTTVGKTIKVDSFVGSEPQGMRAED